MPDIVGNMYNDTDTTVGIFGEIQVIKLGLSFSKIGHVGIWSITKG